MTTATDWISLRHAYGPAGDIPALLARARSEPAPTDYMSEPWFTLWSSLYHQDDIYPASYASVPELVAIAEERGGPVAAESLFLAASIELRRNEPDAPAVPPHLREPYDRAIERARTVVNGLLERDPDPDGKLEVATAVFRGEFARARSLLDEVDDDNK